MANFLGVSREQYLVCNYCKGRAIYFNPVQKSISNVCGYNAVDMYGNPYYRAISDGKPGSINGKKGCGDFKSSGLKAHSLVIGALMQNNSRAEGIPVSDDAPCGKDFSSMKKSYTCIDLRPERLRR